MLFLILCICKAFRLDYMLTLSFPLSNTNQYISSLKYDTLSKSKCDFSPIRRENKELEKGMQLTGFKAVVYAKRNPGGILVYYRMLKCSSYKFAYWK